MKWVEIIKVRMVGGEPESLIETEILQDFRTMEKGNQPTTITLYHHATVESDLSIHIYWESDTVSPRKSSVGVRIVDAIGKLGVVNHSLWIEDERSI